MLRVLIYYYNNNKWCIRFKIQSVYCHVHSVGKQVSLYNEIIYLLSTLNAKTSTNYVKKIKTDIHIHKNKHHKSTAMLQE